MAPSVGELRMRVRALDTWERWADGHPIAEQALRTAAAILDQRPGHQRMLAAAVHDDIDPVGRHRDPDRPATLQIARSPSPELGVEL
jgi:hypothetical protein